MMRTIKKMTLVTLMFVTLLSYAEKREKNLTKSVMVEFVNLKKGQKLFIKDDYGTILHSETIKNGGDLSKAFDLNRLNDGKYTVELEKDFEIIIKPFEIKSNELTFIQNQEFKIFKPVIRNKDDKLYISQISLKSKPVKVEIFYEDELIHSETVKGETTVNRVYKLQDGTLGSYYAIIKTDDRSYKESFKL